MKLPLPLAILLDGAEQWRFRIGGRWRRSGRASFLAGPAIERGTIDALLGDYPLEEGALHAVMPPGRAVTPGSALVDFLVARFGRIRTGIRGAGRRLS
ncbi:MAG TPA: hypothetical protein VEX35_03495 [Allosphingosinicella sp.]|nr:hypothetical protein [Allosphingosinicella sp.]